ncbi:hypothetical protein Cadr_000023662 [Camelus dromedarius]|uniref:Uncharacterized protein n=1 Tax=Camelus dromedarius TaxID=9838 RepID=A0A5N4CW73_CAMDR|nr:hypothetical protein Cadr_000023662 [Camelus dromedarius]
MLPWYPRRWSVGEEQATEEQGLSAGSDPGEAWDSGEESLGELGTPPQDSGEVTGGGCEHQYCPLPVLSPGPEGLPGPSKNSCCHGLPQAWLPSNPLEPQVVPVSPQMTWELAPPRMTLLAPWDPNYEAKAGPRLVWGSQ